MFAVLLYESIGDGPVKMREEIGSLKMYCGYAKHSLRSKSSARGVRVLTKMGWLDCCASVAEARLERIAFKRAMRLKGVWKVSSMSSALCPRALRRSKNKTLQSSKSESSEQFMR